MTKTYLLFCLLLFDLSTYAQRHIVLLHEIMADAEPAQGLPEAEYIELRNVGAHPVQLAGWRLHTTSSTSGVLPAYQLQPDSLVVLTSRTNAVFFGPNTIAVASFPNLVNGAGLLVLKDAAGNTVHAVAYQKDWYGNAVKAEGGWSLELVDAANTCGHANWKASTAPAGGTPGQPNAVAGRNPDHTPPSLLAATAGSANQLVLLFDEPMDSTLLSRVGNFRLDPTIAVGSAQPTGPLFDRVTISFATALDTGKIYWVAVSGLTDCAGNAVGTKNEVKAGLPQPAQPADIVINEILFNPRPDGSDYIELFNRSNRIVDAAKLWITDRTGGALQKLSDTPYYLFPGHYLVASSKPDLVKKNYLVTDVSVLLAVPNMPSLPDDKGSLLVLNETGVLVDELAYHKNWHFALIANPQGVALERIDPDKSTQLRDNWTSAAASAGFGTPGYRNSQHRQPAVNGAAVEVQPHVFSPDNDGFDDFCIISFRLTEPNHVANVFVFDAAGRRQRQLLYNQTLAQSGSWRWDGLGEQGQALPSGTYIVVVELFNLQGKKSAFKKAVALARR